MASIPVKMVASISKASRSRPSLPPQTTSPKEVLRHFKRKPSRSSSYKPNPDQEEDEEEVPEAASGDQEEAGEGLILEGDEPFDGDQGEGDKAGAPSGGSHTGPSASISGPNTGASAPPGGPDTGLPASASGPDPELPLQEATDSAQEEAEAPTGEAAAALVPVTEQELLQEEVPGERRRDQFIPGDLVARLQARKIRDHLKKENYHLLETQFTNNPDVQEALATIKKANQEQAIDINKPLKGDSWTDYYDHLKLQGAFNIANNVSAYNISNASNNNNSNMGQGNSRHYKVVPYASVPMRQPVKEVNLSDDHSTVNKISYHPLSVWATIIALVIILLSALLLRKICSYYRRKAQAATSYQSVAAPVPPPMPLLPIYSEPSPPRAFRYQHAGRNHSAPNRNKHAYSDTEIP